jgi:hypothetical protein
VDVQVHSKQCSLLQRRQHREYSAAFHLLICILRHGIIICKALYQVQSSGLWHHVVFWKSIDVSGKQYFCSHFVRLSEADNLKI